MILENAVIESIVYGGYKVYDNNGNLIESEEPRTALSSEYDDFIKRTSYKHYGDIYGMKELPVINGEEYRVSFMLGHKMTITFTKSIIKWDEFAGRTWYQISAR